MKKKDLKAGEFYAVKDGWRSHLALLLDVESLYRYDWGRAVGSSFTKSTADKPYKSHREQTGYAVVILSADTPELREKAKAITTEHLVAARNAYLSDELKADVVSSLPAFLGPYDEVMQQQEEEKKRAEEAREAKQAKQEEARRQYGALANRLKSLDAKPVEARLYSDSRVDGVQLRFEDVEKLLAMADFVSAAREAHEQAVLDDGSLELDPLLERLDQALKTSE